MAYLEQISNSKTLQAKDVALQNRLNGVQNHSIFGALLASNVNSIFNFGVDIANGKFAKQETEETQPNTTTEEHINKFKEFNALKETFIKNPTKEIYQKLTRFTENNKDNVDIKHNYDSLMGLKIYKELIAKFA